MVGVGEGVGVEAGDGGVARQALGGNLPIGVEELEVAELQRAGVFVHARAELDAAVSVGLGPRAEGRGVGARGLGEVVSDGGGKGAGRLCVGA